MHGQLKLHLVALSCVLGVVAWVPAEAHHGVRLLTIDVPGSTFTGARGINSKGQIVGRYVGTDGTNHGWLLSRGELTTIDFPDAAFTGLAGISPAGDIVGVYMSLVGEPFHGFLLQGDEFTSIDFPGASGTSAAGISGRGDIVGGYCDGSITPCPFVGLGNRGYLLSEGGFTAIDVPGARATLAWGINSRGDIVGIYEDGSSILHGFLFSEGEFASIDFPGAAGTEVYGINARGDIVGAYCPALPCADNAAIVGRRGFLLSGGDFMSFDFPGAEFTRAFGINTRGEIEGAYRDPAGVNHGFLIRRLGEDEVGNDNH